MVFQTAPPHPASNARITWSPQLAGGPDASQNGFGHRMPAKFVVRSAMVHLRHDRERRALAVSDCVHDFAAAVHTIASRVVLRIACPSSGPIDDNTPAFDFDSLYHIDQPRLAECGDHQIAVKNKLALPDRLRFAASACIRL